MKRLEADLNPSLGWRGGPCRVVERIETEVRSPRMRDLLIEKVEHGEKLTNPEAAKIYSIEMDKGGGFFKAIKITSHAQYRMDQRGITVGDLRVSLANYSKQLLKWKNQQAWEWADFSQQTMRRSPVEWLDKKLGGLEIILVNERGTAVIISTYWKGISDPRPKTCPVRSRQAAVTVEEMSGYRTFVKDPTPTKSDTGDTSKDNGKYPTRALPSPPWSRSKPTKGPTVLNGPGESGSDSSGTVHKDKVRTKGVPGGQYPGGKTHPDTPYNNTGITPNRRPGMTADGDSLLEDGWDYEEDGDMSVEAGMYPPAYPGAKRQRAQKGKAKLYFHKRYMRTRGKAKVRQNRRHKRLKNNGRYKADRERREKRPERFERRPGGGAVSIAQRSQKQRDKKKDTPEKSRQDNRTKKASLPIPFYHYPTEMWGDIIEVSPCGFIHFELDDDGRGVAEFDTFFDEVVIDEDRLDELFEHMDEVFEFSDGDDRDLGIPDDDDDSIFESWVMGRLPKVAYAGFRLRRRPENRRHKQRGEDKAKAKQRYKRNRMKSKVQSRKRYKRLKKNPQFKKQQAVRRKHPERFKMRMGEVLTAPEIAFVLELDGRLVLAYVRNISGMTGLVSFYTVEPNRRMLQSMPVRVLLSMATFLSVEDEDAMYELIDAEVGVEAYGGPEELDQNLVNLYTIESEFAHMREKRDGVDEYDHLLRDPTDDDFYYGAVVKLANEVIADFLREQRPPQMDPNTVYDRANDHNKRQRHDRLPGTPGLNGPHEKEVHDSNPGSRVYPSGKDHVEKSAARAIYLPKPRIRKVSKELVTLLLRRVKNDDSPVGNVKSLVRTAINLTRADGEEMVVAIIVRSGVGRGKRQGFVSSGGAGVLKSTGQPLALVQFDGRYTGGDVHLSVSGSTALEDMIFGVLIHEFTHVADPSLVPSTKGGEVQSPDDWDAYHNNPSEVRAYLQNIVDELQRWFQTWDKKEKVFGRNALRYALKSSRTWKDVEKDLNPKNRKYIMKAVWTALQDFQADASMARNAALIGEIREGCSPDIQNRSEGLKVKLARVDAKNAVWLFNVEGSKKPYRVKMKATRKGNIRSLQKTHVKVSCSCPFWQWQGPEFHAKQGDYLYGKAQGSASKPDVKDPNGQHRACKHVLAVLDFVTSRDWQVPKPKRLAARYLVDSIRLGEVVVESPEFIMRSRKLAARYLASMEVPDA